MITLIYSIYAPPSLEVVGDQALFLIGKKLYVGPVKEFGRLFVTASRWYRIFYQAWIPLCFGLLFFYGSLEWSLVILILWPGVFHQVAKSIMAPKFYKHSLFSWDLKSSYSSVAPSVLDLSIKNQLEVFVSIVASGLVGLILLSEVFLFYFLGSILFFGIIPFSLLVTLWSLNAIVLSGWVQVASKERHNVVHVSDKGIFLKGKTGELALIALKSKNTARQIVS